MINGKIWTRKPEEQRRFHLWELDMTGEAWEKVLMRYLPEGQGRTALDVGCGTGFLSILMARNGWNVVAVDNSASMAEQAKATAEYYGLADRITVLQADADQNHLESDSFDAVVSRHASFLFTDPEAAYREIHRVLKPGGTFLNLVANWMAPVWDHHTAAQFQADERALVEQYGHYEDIYHDRRMMEKLTWLPLSNQTRPVWDELMCKHIGFSSVGSRFLTDERLWHPIMAMRYRAVPTFAFTAVK